MKIAYCLSHHCTIFEPQRHVIPTFSSADHHEEDSIRTIEPAVFKLDQSEIDNIKQRMQDAVDGALIPGAPDSSWHFQRSRAA